MFDLRFAKILLVFACCLAKVSNALSSSHPQDIKKNNVVSTVESFAWLNDVREVRHPIDMMHPLVVRTANVIEGPPLPQPSVPFPEKHPYCELNFNFEGKVLQFIGAEKFERTAGDLMLMGPGMPHYATRLSYPHRTITVHFLPILLFEMGPNGDGARVLARFTTPQRITSRILCPPEELTVKLARQFILLAEEFENPQNGSEFRLRSLLIEILVDVLRWEESTGKILANSPSAMYWFNVEKALRFLHENYGSAVYIEEIARASGLGVTRLQKTFRELLGMSCVQYLRALRIFQAKVLLCAPEVRITEVALEVGFETLSHFNTSFRSLIGMSPSNFVREHQQKKK